ncbi:glycosyltransferase [Candidatus Pelagibacter communis]|uniref:glycosyltransferase n=1 Tax=Pelagibacter ubique TaxID=198252 RepID=UPI00094D05E3|nr:glycosyltransferase [Candidatus Pelagibacter ubique]
MKSNFKKKRIIFFLPVFKLGGASESITRLSKFLVDQNFSVLLISIGKNSYKKYLKKIGCDVYEMKSKRALFSIFSLRNLIKDEINKEYLQTILISNIHYANLISLISCINLSKVKIILTERSSLSELNIYNNFFRFLKNKLVFFLAKYFYRFADLIITNSKFEKNFIINNFNIKNIKYIYPPSISKINKGNRLRNKINCLKKIIYVGRLSKEKGVITIVEALSEIKDKFNFTFEIYGDGIEKDNIKRFIKSKRLDKKVIFKGYNKDRDKIFKNANLFINASWFEGLPNALVQSINYNVFPICSKSPGGNFEVIKYGKLGLTFKPGSSYELKNKILIFLNKNLKLNPKIRHKHLKNFTQTKSNQEYFKTLNNLK